MVNQIANYIVALTTPIFIDRTTFGAYYFFAAWGLVGTIVCYLYMVETRGHSLEFIEQRYMDDKAAKATAADDGFKVRTTVKATPVVTATEESDGVMSEG